MKKLFLIIIGLCLCTALYADMNTYIIGAVSAGGSYEIEDHFTADTTSNYIITEYEGSPAVSISGEKLHQTAAAYKYAYGYHSTALTSVDHYVQAKITIGTSLADYTFIQARHNGTSTCYRARFAGEGGTDIVLYRVVAGSATYLDSYALGAVEDQEYNVKLSVSGAGDTVTVTVNIDGTDRITVNDTNAARITAGSYVGFGFKQTSNNRDVTIDDFIADTL